jgi:tripartite-type tricarboxylate transporter receptor subunit TctC
VFVPAKTPRDIVEHLYQEITKAQKDPEVADKLSKLGVQPMPMTPAKFDDYVRKELVQNAEIAKTIGISPQ